MEPQRGHALLEWTLGSALGMFLAATAVWLFAQQGQLMKSLLTRHAQEQDFTAIAQLMSTELKTAGQRDRLGPSPAHDQIQLDERRSSSLQYLCDRCGSPDVAHAAGFRLQDGILGHRSLGTTAYQPLNDPRAAVVRQWRIARGQTNDCSPWIVLEFQGDATLPGAGVARVVTVRPRNLGLLSCESTGLNAAPPSLMSASSSVGGQTAIHP